eukprot:COSAG02_NODE_264_length_26618_cov_244.096459_11_plen_1778_part_00
MAAEQEDVPAWLKANNLGEYADEFMKHGYDDLKDLCQYTDDEFCGLKELVGIKQGHANKLRRLLKARRTSGAETAATNTTAGPAAKRSPPASAEDHTASRAAKKTRTVGTEHELNGHSGAPASSAAVGSDVDGPYARSAGPRAPDSSALQSNGNLADKELARSNRRLSAPFSPVSVPQMVERGVPKSAHLDGEGPDASTWNDDGDGDVLCPPSLGAPGADEDGGHPLHANEDATKGHSASTVQQMPEQDEGNYIDEASSAGRKRRTQDKPENVCKRRPVAEASAALLASAAEAPRDDSSLTASSAMSAAAASMSISAAQLKPTVHDVALLWPQETTCIQLDVMNPLFADGAHSSRHHLIQMCASDDAQRQLLTSYCHEIASGNLSSEDAGVKFFPIEQKATLQQIVKVLRKQLPTKLPSWGTAASGKQEQHRAIFGIQKRATNSMCDMREELFSAFFNDPKGLNAYDREVLWCLHVLETLQPNPWIRIRYTGSDQSQVANSLMIPQTVERLKIDVLQASAAAASLPDRSSENIYRQPCYCLWRVISAALPEQLGPRASSDWAPGLRMLEAASIVTRERRQREGQDAFALPREQEQILGQKVATQLFPYQKSNLAFLLQRERHDVQPAGADPLWCPLRTHGGQTFWFEPTEGYVSTKPPQDVSPPIRGGMLADEMGLGKTAVAIALAHLHPRPSNYTAPNQVYEVDWARSTSAHCPDSALQHATTCEQAAFSFKKSDLSQLLRESQSPPRSQCVFLMVTLGDPNISVWVGAGAKKIHLPDLQCTRWDLGDMIGRSFATQQHFERVGTIRVNLQGHIIEDFQHWQFWRTPQSRRQTAATLVVCPQALVHQWESQIKMHSCEPQNVFRYQCAGNQQQQQAAEEALVQADWVVMTYHELALLNAKDAPVSIEWWRVVIDEAQTMQDAKLLQKALATKLQAVNRVLLSGTPVTIGSTVDDLSPLFKFFGIQPYCDSWFWDEGVKAKVGDGTPAETARLEKILGQLMTRTLKTDFSSAELGRMMNDQHEEKISVRFSQLESCLYKHELQLLKEKRTTMEAIHMCCSYPMHWGKADSLAEMCEKQHQIAMDNLQMSQHTVLARINERGDLYKLLFDQHTHTHTQQLLDQAQTAYSDALSFDVTRPDVDTHYQKAHAAACLVQISNSHGDEIARWANAMINPTFELAKAAVSVVEQASTQPTDISSVVGDEEACWDIVQDWSKSKTTSEFDSVKQQVQEAGFALAYYKTEDQATGDDRLTGIGGPQTTDRATKSATAGSAVTDSRIPKGQTLPAVGTELLVELPIDALTGEVTTELHRWASKKRKTKKDKEIEKDICKELEKLERIKKLRGRHKTSIATVSKHIDKTTFIVELERMHHHQDKKSPTKVLTLGDARFQVVKRGIAGVLEIPDLFVQLRDESNFVDQTDGTKFFKAMTRKGPQDTDVPVGVTNMAVLIERLRLFFKECRHCQQNARKEIAALSAMVLSSGAEQSIISQTAKDVFDANQSTNFRPSMWTEYATCVFRFGSCIFRVESLYFNDIEDGVNSGRWRTTGKAFCNYTTQMEAVLCWIAERPRQCTMIKDAAKKLVSEIHGWKVEFMAQRSAVIQTLQHLHRLHLSSRAKAAPTMLDRHREMMELRAKNAQRAKNPILRYSQQEWDTPQSAAAAAPANEPGMREHPPAWQYEVGGSEGQSGIEQRLRQMISTGTIALKRAKEDCATASELAHKLQELQQPVQCTFCQDRINPGAVAVVHHLYTITLESLVQLARHPSTCVRRNSFLLVFSLTE